MCTQSCFVVLASNPWVVGTEEHLLLNFLNSRCSHSTPAGSDHHLEDRLEESERCSLPVVVALCWARMLDICALADDPEEEAERLVVGRLQTFEL